MYRHLRSGYLLLHFRVRHPPQVMMRYLKLTFLMQNCLDAEQQNHVPTAMRISRFVAHRNTIQKMDHCFRTVFQGIPQGPVIAALVAMGGIGKTQVALEYCKQGYNRDKDAFHEVFWFNVSSEETTLASFAKIADLLAPKGYQFSNISDRVEFVRMKFENHEQPYMIVMDNYEDPSFDTIAEFLPSSGCCAVLITTHLRETEELRILIVILR